MSGFRQNEKHHAKHSKSPNVLLNSATLGFLEGAMAVLSADDWRRVAEHYHRKASECRTKAGETKDAWARQSYLESAEYWMRLGVGAARRLPAVVSALEKSDRVERELPASRLNDVDIY